MYDFADILFSGPCNARCGFCIGQQVAPSRNVTNLDLFPPRSLEAFLERVKEHSIRQVVLTGTNTDPQLYRHERRLLRLLRERLGTGVQLALHTNGLLALRKMEVFNQYDRVSLSFPSFDPLTYRAMMGVPQPPDLREILQQAQVPVKISCLVNDQNRLELADFLEHCERLGVQRVVFRKLVGDKRRWEELVPMDGLNLRPQGNYRGNPVYQYEKMEVTLWDFEATESRAVHLFSSGEILDSYPLTAFPAANGEIPTLPRSTAPHRTAPPRRQPAA